MAILNFADRKKAREQEISRARGENRFAFNSDLPKLITSNPGEYVVYEHGFLVGIFKTRESAKGHVCGPEYTLFEIPATND